MKLSESQVIEVAAELAAAVVQAHPVSMDDTKALKRAVTIFGQTVAELSRLHGDRSAKEIVRDAAGKVS